MFSIKAVCLQVSVCSVAASIPAAMPGFGAGSSPSLVATCICLFSHSPSRANCWHWVHRSTCSYFREINLFFPSPHPCEVPWSVPKWEANIYFFFKCKFHCILLIANRVVEFCSCLIKERAKRDVGHVLSRHSFVGVIIIRLCSPQVPFVSECRARPFVCWERSAFAFHFHLVGRWEQKCQRVPLGGSKEGNWFLAGISFFLL